MRHFLSETVETLPPRHKLYSGDLTVRKGAYITFKDRPSLVVTLNLGHSYTSHLIVIAISKHIVTIRSKVGVMAMEDIISHYQTSNRSSSILITLSIPSLIPS